SVGHGRGSAAGRDWNGEAGRFGDVDLHLVSAFAAARDVGGRAERQDLRLLDPLARGRALGDDPAGAILEERRKPLAFDEASNEVRGHARSFAFAVNGPRRTDGSRPTLSADPQRWESVCSTPRWSRTRATMVSIASSSVLGRP